MEHARLVWMDFAQIKTVLIFYSISSIIVRHFLRRCWCHIFKRCACALGIVFFKIYKEIICMAFCSRCSLHLKVLIVGFALVKKIGNFKCVLNLCCYRYSIFYSNIELFTRSFPIIFLYTLFALTFVHFSRAELEHRNMAVWYFSMIFRFQTIGRSQR